MSILIAILLSVMASAPVVPLTGTTVDHDGRPVVGAELWLVGIAGLEDAPIVARGRSDNRGRFALERPAALAGSGRFRPVTVWAYKPGLRVAWREYPENVPRPELPVRLELGPPTGTELRVVGPDEEPVAGARVRVERLQPFRGLPEPLADRLEATTDSGGRTVLDGFEAVELASLEVRAEGFGQQPREFCPPSGGAKAVRLRTATSVAGWLVAEDPRVVKGWKISAWTTPSRGQTDRDGYWIGHADAVTDDQGRFRIPAIAAGNLALTCEPPDGLPYRAKAPSGPELSIDLENEVAVSVLKAARVEGVFRDRVTGGQVPGVRINFYSTADGNRFPVTDDRGRFAVYALPAPYVATPGRGNRVVKLPEAVDHLDVEPFELIRRGRPLEGVALDESGRPVPEALVTGAWSLPEEKAGGILTASASSDERGRFQLAEVAPGAEVRVFARHRELAMPGPVMARAGQEEPLTLRLTRMGTATIRGRVLRPDGQPLAKAWIEVYFEAHVDCVGFVAGSFRFDGARAVQTGDDGAFQTPRELLRIGRYQVNAVADGYAKRGSEFVELDPGDVTTVPDLVLKRSLRLRVVAGRVVDHRGVPIAGADVLQSDDGLSRTRARTDAQGRFRIHGVAQGPALLFAEKPGYRFTGRLIGAGIEPVELVLDRSDEPPREVRKAVAWPMPRVDERALARKLLEPAFAAIQGRDPYNQRDAVLLAMARVDPERLLEMIENRVVAPLPHLLQAATAGIMEDKPRQAVATVESDRHPASRAGGYLALFHVAAAEPADFRRDLLERALAESRHVEAPAARAPLLAQIGDGWLSLGDPGRAAPILRNARALYGRASQRQFPPMVEGLAAPLAVIDLPSALAIVEGRNNLPRGYHPSVVDRELGEMAARIAGTNPAESERLLGRLGDPSWFGREEWVLRACRNMASIDLARARRIAATMLRPPLHPAQAERVTLELYAQLAMADTLARSDPPAARRLLEETIARLRRVAMEDRVRYEMPPPACLLAGCLPLVERLIPDRLEECLAMAVASRAPRSDEPDVGEVQTLATLAALVARYDPAAAGTIAQPVFENVPELVVPPFRNGGILGVEQVFTALAGVDPRRTAALVERLPEDYEYMDSRFKQLVGARPMWIDAQTKGRIAVARVLGLPIERRRQEIGKVVIDPWVLGEAP
jgi:protocatechuate 3,4-dioxygenase beta subunit